MLLNKSSGWPPSLLIDNITIVQNENAGDDGGGLAVNSGDPIITNVLIVNNKAKFDGGGLYFDDATPVITNATIANNRADDDGGGIPTILLSLTTPL